MAVLEQFCLVSAKFSNCADFSCVYIEEAHPSERPNFTGNLQIGEHQDLHQRLEASRVLSKVRTKEAKFNILVDLMDNKASKAYAALPERFYVILDGVIIYEGGQGPFDCKIEEVEQLLEEYQQSLSKTVLP